uniref:Uncharacterized protein n=1 Tax=Meloidogyne enterolobii TaxID=390850 RepID=A0A6V7UTD6_MELEN|nr:unnamed protein product [Meloidogyne enterolobii]
MNVNQNNRIGDFFFKKNGSFFKIEVNQDNVFIIELNNASKYINQLKQRSLIEIANNQIIQQFLPKFEKQVLVNNNFVKNANYYETSILDEVLDKNYNNVNSKKDKKNTKTNFYQVTGRKLI